MFCFDFVPLTDSISRYFAENVSRESTNCTCPVPCERVRYEPSLSYAQLSRINVERYVVRDEEKRKQLEVKNPISVQFKCFDYSRNCANEFLLNLILLTNLVNNTATSGTLHRGDLLLSSNCTNCK